MTYEIETRRVEARPTLMMRGRVGTEDLAGTIGEYLQTVWERIEEVGEEPAGPPYTRYHDVADDEVDLEAGIPVRVPLEGDGEVGPSSLPGGEVAATDHWGHYEDLPAAGAALGAWAARNGRKAAGPRWEVYWTDPTEVDDPDDIRTEVLMPLAPEGGA